MGILGDIFNVFSLKKEPKTPKLESILPLRVTEVLKEGRLVNLQKHDSLILALGEICHYADKAYRYNGRISSTEYDCPVGKFYITSRRLIFVAYHAGFDYPYSLLTSVELFDDGLVLQFGEKTLVMGIPSAKQAYQVIQILKKNKK